MNYLLVYQKNCIMIFMKKITSPHRIDHLANERTFLAWIRTSIGIMAFGFVVEKFALFMKEIAHFLGQDSGTKTPSGYSPIFGIVLVGLGALIGLLSYLRFINIQKQIEEESYKKSNKLAASLTLLIVVMGILLLIYLI